MIMLNERVGVLKKLKDGYDQIWNSFLKADY